MQRMRVAFGLGFREMSFRVSPAGLARMRARALALPDVPDGAGSRRHGRAVPNEGNRAGVSGADRSRGDGVSVKGNRFAWRFQFPGGCDVADSGLHLGLWAGELPHTVSKASAASASGFMRSSAEEIIVAAVNASIWTDGFEVSISIPLRLTFPRSRAGPSGNTKALRSAGGISKLWR